MTPKRKSGDTRPEEGAVLLVVMLVLLMVTATATFAIHSTASEVRAAGHSRIAMQTDYVAEAALIAAMDWVDRSSPRLLVELMDRYESTRTQIDMAPFEPPLYVGTGDATTPNREFAYRLYENDLTPVAVGGGANPDPIADTSFGLRNAYTPLVLVDVYDVHVYTGVTAGYVASGGSGGFRFLRATYTARGRARLSSGTAAAQNLHEAAADARAIGISGPFAM
jgi:hypothetical protein